MRRLLSSVLVLYLGVSLSLCFTPPRSSCGSIITGIWQHGQPPHFSRHQVSSRALGMPLRSSPEVSDEPVGPFSPTYVASFRRLTSLKWISRTLDWIKSSRGAKEGKQITVDVAVVGAGIAGLICARELYRKGFDVLLLEASDGVGGRIRTDIVKGFLLDRGFQVFIEAYPEAGRQLDYWPLDLQKFRPGALVHVDGKLSLVSDPFRRPQDLVAGLKAPVGTLLDKILVGLYRATSWSRSVSSIMESKDDTTASFLTSTLCLSPEIVERFFTPFYRGIFLAPLEMQSSRLFEFVFKMFADGSTSLPAAGMGAIPQQVAADLPQNKIRLNTPVLAVSAGITGAAAPVGVVLDLGSKQAVNARAAVIAADPLAASKLLGNRLPPFPAGRASTCLYFSLPAPPPVSDPLLILNGEPTSPTAPVNNLVFLDSIAPSYAPLGRSLASVTVVGNPAESDETLADACLRQISRWFPGQNVETWKLLRSYRVPYAQPAQALNESSLDKVVSLGDGIFVCGDYVATPTLDGAMRSGRRAAEAVISSLASTM